MSSVWESGWVYWVGIPGGYTGGLYRGTTQPPRGDLQTQRSGPRKACRAWSGWGLEVGRAPAVVFGGGTAPRTTLRARSGTRPLPVLGPLECRLWAKGARFHLISHKVSQKARVSPKYVEKACHSPYLQNGLQKSPLDFLRFRFSLAFSHKELMVPFLTYAGVYCQNDEVSPKCHPYVTREVVADTPTITAASCFW